MIAFAKPDNVIAMPQKSNEWYTPARYVDAARAVMGGIDLDPASCKEANLVVRANRYYTQRDNGLLMPWYGRVYLNPPYTRTLAMKARHLSTIKQFVDKLVSEYQIGHVEQAIALVTCQVDSSWFQSLWEYPLCFSNRKVHFVTPFKRESGSYTHFFGTVFAYLGTNEQRFIDIFSQFGTIAKRVSQPRQTVTPLSLWGDA